MDNAYKVGDLVRVNSTYPYGDRGRRGVVAFVPKRRADVTWIDVLFEGSKVPARWHRGYFDLEARKAEGEDKAAAVKFAAAYGAEIGEMIEREWDNIAKPLPPHG